MRATLPAVLMAAHSAARAYHIGQPGAKWGPAEVAIPFVELAILLISK